ncbi:MAG: aminodeoxychorismate/anthranilate synthase component II [Myxococcales bacterium]|nr:aminodeoxychorismate/anthranilate synthase component II [Myxococcales bacterium]
MIVVIDNYDSFTYNLVQYLGELGAEVVVYRNDQISAQDVAQARPAGVLISPGPGRPEDSRVSVDLLETLDEDVPVLGVCLGHQCIAQRFGARVVRADRLMHGRTSSIEHDGLGVFEGLPSPFTATRYHSLIVDPASVPPELQVSARTARGEIMGLRHRTQPIEGVQFHPESFLTEHGHAMLRNWMRRLPPGSSAGGAPPAAREAVS